LAFNHRALSRIHGTGFGSDPVRTPAAAADRRTHARRVHGLSRRPQRVARRACVRSSGSECPPPAVCRGAASAASAIPLGPVTRAGVGSWAVHPGGPKILDAFASAMSLPTGALAISRDVLAECGNMSSPTVLFILDRLRRQHAPRPCVALGFGPGLAVEAALF